MVEGLAIGIWTSCPLLISFSIPILVWNEIPTALGNLVGGLAFTGLTLYTTHVRTAPKRTVY